MLKFKQTQTFAATVDVRLPTERPDEYAEGSFTAHFEHVPKARYTEILDHLQTLATGEGGVQVSDIVAYKEETLGGVLKRVDGIEVDGRALDPADGRTLVLAELPLLNATFDAFIGNYSGAAAKNLKPSPRR